MHNSDGQTSITIATDATILTIAGSDPSGGAGLQADLKTFQQLGCYGMSVITLLTVQNTQGVDRVEVLSTELIEQQLKAVLSDISPRVVKTGALGSAEVICSVAEQLQSHRLPLVVDPVLISKHGHRLADDECLDAYREQLMPLANVFTPNRFEAEALLERELNSLQDMADAAAALRSLGPQFVVLKAGEFDGQFHHMVAGDADQVTGLSLDALEQDDTHGAGCVFSAALASWLCLHLSGSLEPALVTQAVRFAAAAVHHAIDFAPGLGNGLGPVETRVIRADAAAE